MNGHEVVSSYRFGSPPVEDGERHRISVPLPPALYGSVPSDSAFCALAARALARLHRRRPFDVVHLHGDFPEAWLGGFCSTRLGLPTVMTIHGALSPRWAGTLGRAVKALDAVICVGENIRDQLVAVGTTQDKLHVISSGVDVEGVRAAGRAPPSGSDGMGRPLIVAAGALDRVKGYDTLLSSFSIVRNRHPNATVVIAGDGRERLRLQREATEGAMLIGSRPRREVWSWLGTADVVVIPSRELRGKAEGVPTVLLEALAAGTRVVATCTGGMPGVLGDDIGSLAAPDDARVLAAAILDAVSQGPPTPAERARIEAAAAARDWKPVTAQVTEVLATSRRWQ